MPALVIGGKVQTENLPIQLLIASQPPKTVLMPTDPLASARAVSVLAWYASGMHPEIAQQARPERDCASAEMRTTCELQIAAAR